MVATILLSWFPWSGGEDEEDDSGGPSERELRVEAYKKQRSVSRIQEQVDNHRNQYQKYLEKGATAPDTERKTLVTKARIQKYKGNLRKLELKKELSDLNQLTAKQGEMEIKALADEVTGGSNELADNIELDPEGINEMTDEAEAQIHADGRAADEAMEALQDPQANLESGQTEEEKIMDEIAQGQAVPDDFGLDNIESSPTTESARSENVETETEAEFGEGL
jgi:hypothetical protein